MTSFRHQKYFSYKGFTLVEVLAVMVLIGIAAGLLTVSIGDGSRAQMVKSATRALYGSMVLVQEEAVFTSRQYGLRFDVEPGEDDVVYSYNWLVYDADNLRWVDAAIEEVNPGKLQEGIVLELEVDEQQVIIGKQESDDNAIFSVEKQDNEKIALQPDLYFISTGELQDFTISVTDELSPREDGTYRIKGNLLGQLDFKRPGDEDE